MGLFSRKPAQEAASPAGETQVAKARETIVTDLAGASTTLTGPRRSGSSPAARRWSLRPSGAPHGSNTELSQILAPSPRVMSL